VQFTLSSSIVYRRGAGQDLRTEYTRRGRRRRSQNEKKFGQWDELPRGGRRYWCDVPGRLGWLARYVKEVDVNETTLRFWQEIYDDQGKLVELHEQYPVDKGHQPT
jgi:hypothetical protein